MSDITYDIPDAPEPLETPDWHDIDIADDVSADAVLPAEQVDITDSDLREIGYPQEAAQYWQQQDGEADCAVYAQAGILEAAGQECNIDKYRQQGMEAGWYNPEEGTYPDTMGNLLEENGIPVTRSENATIQDMAYELSQGHGVLAAVDCEPLWGEPGGHCLWVTGMEVSPDGTPAYIVCNDSGRPDGAAIQYAYENFAQAWGAYDNMMVATVAPVLGSNG